MPLHFCRYRFFYSLFQYLVRKFKDSKKKENKGEWFFLHLNAIENILVNNALQSIVYPCSAPGYLLLFFFVESKPLAKSPLTMALCCSS